MGEVSKYYLVPVVCVAVCFVILFVVHASHRSPSDNLETYSLFVNGTFDTPSVAVGSLVVRVGWYGISTRHTGPGKPDYARPNSAFFYVKNIGSKVWRSVGTRATLYGPDGRVIAHNSMWGKIWSGKERGVTLDVGDWSVWKYPVGTTEGFRVIVWNEREGWQVIANLSGDER